MRFGSIRAFLKFVQMLMGVGYICQHPLYTIEEELKRLPMYISKYQIVIAPMDSMLHIGLYRGNTCCYELLMGAPV